MSYEHSLAHTKWDCKYHVVFAPKYRRKVFYGQKRYEIGQILRELCKWKGVTVLSAEACPDHIHMMLEIPPKYSISGFMGFLKGKSSLMIYEKWGNMKYKYRNRQFWCRGYYVSTVGKQEKVIERYGLVRINIYKTSDRIHVHVEELDTGAITVTGEGTDWDIEENNGRFKNINDYIDCFIRNKENVKSVKRISNDTIEIVWYDEEFKGCMKSKHQFCVTKDLIGTVTLDMDVVRKNDVDKA